MTKPREFWITRKEDGSLTHIALFEYHKDKNPLHVREVVPIDWERVWHSMCDMGISNKNFQVIRHLVEKQLRGEE